MCASSGTPLCHGWHTRMCQSVTGGGCQLGTGSGSADLHLEETRPARTFGALELLQPFELLEVTEHGPAAHPAAGGDLVDGVPRLAVVVGLVGEAEQHHERGSGRLRVLPHVGANEDAHRPARDRAKARRGWRRASLLLAEQPPVPTRKGNGISVGA